MLLLSYSRPVYSVRFETLAPLAVVYPYGSYVYWVRTVPLASVSAPVLPRASLRKFQFPPLSVRR